MVRTDDAVFGGPHTGSLALAARVRCWSNGRAIPNRHLQDASVTERPALIRCGWDRDGETRVHGAVQDRVGELAHVRIDDHRIGQVRWAWVDAGDVRTI